MVKIIGNGQIAKLFQENENIENSLIFASGVADSKCIDEQQFTKEKMLLIESLKIAKESSLILVYFSSCALSAEKYILNKYYQHKREMEETIKEFTDYYLIIRVPQLFGKIKKHPTLINFIYYKIIENKEFFVYSNAYRYVIHMDDLYDIVKQLFILERRNQTIDVANPYRYSILDIVKQLEEGIGIKAKYEIIQMNDGYILDFTDMMSVVKTLDKRIEFGENYLYEKVEYLIMDKEL